MTETRTFTPHQLKAYTDMVRDAALEEAAKIACDQEVIFGSDEYSVNQPMSSHGERFACRQIADEVRDLKLSDADNSIAMKNSCSQCRFWEQGVSCLSAFMLKEGVGECRKNAPSGPINTSFIGDQARVVVNAFPPTAKDDWCGEFQSIKKEA